jgi:hypothetical protein
MEKEGIGAEIEIEAKDEAGYSEQEIDIRIESGISVSQSSDPGSNTSSNPPKTIFEKKRKDSK